MNPVAGHIWPQEVPFSCFDEQRIRASPVASLSLGTCDRDTRFPLERRRLLEPALKFLHSMVPESSEASPTECPRAFPFTIKSKSSCPRCLGLLCRLQQVLQKSWDPLCRYFVAWLACYGSQW